MLERILSRTQIVELPALTASDIDRCLTYLIGPEGRCAVVVDATPLPWRDHLVAELSARKRPITVLSGVEPNPSTTTVDKLSVLLGGMPHQAIIGLGGGSTLDAAKALAIMYAGGGGLIDYLGPSPERAAKERKIKLILVPTTAGTGSEVTRFGVYTAPTGRKYTLNNVALQADVAILCGELTASMPPQVTAATAFDALAHALETLWNRNATAISDEIATESVIEILRWIEPAYASSRSGKRHGRHEMLRASCMAGIGFNLTGTAAVHALSFILSEEWHVPHGTACAFTLENILALNAKEGRVREKLGAIMCRIAPADAQADPASWWDARIRQLKGAMGMPKRFADLGINVSPTQLPHLFERAFQDPKMGLNAVTLSKDVIYAMLASKI